MNWFGDDSFRFDLFSSKYANCFTYCVTTDKFSVQKYKEIGQKNIILSQHASFENDKPYKNLDYKYEVSFVGTKNPYREWFISELYKRGIKCECFGNGWENGRVSYEELNTIFLN